MLTAESNRLLQRERESWVMARGLRLPPDAPDENSFMVEYLFLICATVVVDPYIAKHLS